jgi:hypothetical protein
MSNEEQNGNCAKPLLAAVPLDGDGQILQEGDRVFTHGFTDNGFGRHYGTLHRNAEFPEVSDWFINYDDKEQCAVLDFADVFKA